MAERAADKDVLARRTMLDDVEQFARVLLGRNKAVLSVTMRKSSSIAFEADASNSLFSETAKETHGFADHDLRPGRLSNYSEMSYTT